MPNPNLSASLSEDRTVLEFKQAGALTAAALIVRLSLLPPETLITSSRWNQRERIGVAVTGISNDQGGWVHIYMGDANISFH